MTTKIGGFGLIVFGGTNKKMGGKIFCDTGVFFKSETQH
jgi:hypothetical protein